jgi:urea carboxylase
LYAPLDANVWKVNVADGNFISSAQVVAILEAMKMEVSVSYNGDKKDGADQSFKVEKVLVQPGDTIKAGDALVFLRKI